MPPVPCPAVWTSNGISNVPAQWLSRFPVSGERYCREGMRLATLCSRAATSRPKMSKSTTARTKRNLFWFPAVIAVGLMCRGAAAEAVAYPVKVVPGQHYFSDANGRPFFWLGTTQWELFRGYSREDARATIERCHANGFTVVQVKLLGQGDGSRPNFYQQAPFLDDDALKPNEKYFENVDAVVKAARENNLAILMTVFHQSYRNRITQEKARAWALSSLTKRNPSQRRMPWWMRFS